MTLWQQAGRGRSRYLAAVLMVPIMLLTACGYHHPLAHRPASAPQKIFTPLWRNNTNILGLEEQIVAALQEWLRRSPTHTASRSREHATLILEGTVESLQSPAISYGSFDEARELQAVLTVSYRLRETGNEGRILLDERHFTVSQPYSVGSSWLATSDARQQAINSMVNDLTAKIYLQLQLPDYLQADPDAASLTGS